MKFTTETGSRYESKIEGNAVWVRRQGKIQMRRDNDWVRLYGSTGPVVGESMQLVLDGVAEYGMTVRQTGRVVSIEEE